MYNSKLNIYSALDVARMCGVVNQTVINWIKSGQLKAIVTPGGQYRITPDDLFVFLRKRGMPIPSALQHIELQTNTASVLIIDDDVVLNNTMSAFFNKNLQGFSIHQAFDGFEAGVIISKIRPKYLILDLNLPGVDGFEICRKIKYDSAFGLPYIVVITAFDDEKTKRKIMKLGADSFYTKPVEFQVILDEIQQNINVSPVHFLGVGDTN